ncbi:hypothetical protein [Geodermatophilus sp. SYSU D00815]
MSDVPAERPADEDLLRALGEALREADAVPPRITETGKALFGLYTLDADLAALASDAAAPAGVRAAPAGTRELDFTTGGLTLHVEVSGRGVSGQVVPPQAGEVDLQTADGRPRRVPVDELGWFTVAPPPREEFRLLFLGSGGARALTGWIAVG